MERSTSSPGRADRPGTAAAVHSDRPARRNGAAAAETLAPQDRSQPPSQAPSQPHAQAARAVAQPADWPAIPGTLGWSLDAAGALQADGVALARLTGKVPTDRDGLLALVRAEDRARIAADIARALAGGGEFIHDFVLAHPQHGPRQMQGRGALGPGGRLQALWLEMPTPTPAPAPDLIQAPATPGDWLLRTAEAAGFGPYTRDIASGRLDCSPELMRIAGLPAEQPLRSLAEALLFVHPEDRAPLVARLDGFDRCPGPYTQEFRMLLPDGTVLWVQDNGEVLGPRDPLTGRGRQAVGVLTITTSRKLAERSLAEANALLENLFVNVPLGLGVWDRDFRFVRVNAALAEMNGVPIAEHVGRRPDEILPEIENIEGLYDRWRQILDTGEPWLDVEVTGETANAPGRPRVWREHFFPVIAEGEVVGIAALVEDVTEERAHARATQLQAERMRRVLDASVGFIGVIGPDGRLREANARLLETLEVPREAVIGRPLWDTPWWGYCPAVAERLRAAVARAAQGEAMRYDEHLHLPDGREMDIDFMLTPITDAAGRVTEIIPSAIDITARKAALARVELLMREVNHRSKNALTLVQAIARQTARATPERFLERFSERIRALTAAQDLLVRSDWHSIDFETLIRAQLAHFADAMDRRILLEGPECRISAEAAQNMGMALHELATNAGKYGALSNETGVVTIRWWLEPDAEAPRLSVRWSEAQGPAVRPPERRGFGSTLIDLMLRASLDAEVTLDFAPDGFSWHLAHGRCLVTDPAA